MCRYFLLQSVGHEDAKYGEEQNGVEMAIEYKKYTF